MLKQLAGPYIHFIFMSESSRTRQTNSQLYMCMSSPFRGLATTKTSPKKYLQVGEIDTIFNTPCLSTSNALIQFK